MDKGTLLTKFARLLNGVAYGEVITTLLDARLAAVVQTRQITECKRELALAEAHALLGSEGKSKEVREAEAVVALAGSADYKDILKHLDIAQDGLATSEAIAEAARAMLRLVEMHAGAVATASQLTQMVGAGS